MKEANSLIPFYLGKLFAQAAIPKWAIALGVGLFDYVFPTIAPSVALATWILVIFDTFSGILRAHATKQEVTSAKLGRFLTKSFSYAIAVGTIALVLHIVPNTQAFQPAVVTTTMTGIAGTEAYSIFENLRVVGYDLPKPVKDWFYALLAKITPSTPPKP